MDFNTKESARMVLRISEYIEFPRQDPVKTNLATIQKPKVEIKQD